MSDSLTWCGWTWCDSAGLTTAAPAVRLGGMNSGTGH